eukprot:730-Chlamydomonas_euryale.AAC.5
MPCHVTLLDVVTRVIWIKSSTQLAFANSSICRSQWKTTVLDGLEAVKVKHPTISNSALYKHTLPALHAATE